jgi:hypothetical protein
MVQLAMLAMAWVLMRRYVLRRRTRLDRESIVRKLTEKLRSLAKPIRSSPHAAARKKSTLAAMSI